MLEQSETLSTGSQKKLFQNANEFSMFIEKLAVDQGIPCYNTLINWCEENDVEPEDIAKSVSRQLKEKIAVEFAEIGLLKKAASLYD
jgi:hypothetical protein